MLSLSQVPDEVLLEIVQFKLCSLCGIFPLYPPRTQPPQSERQLHPDAISTPSVAWIGRLIWPACLSTKSVLHEQVTFSNRSPPSIWTPLHLSYPVLPRCQEPYCRKLASAGRRGAEAAHNSLWACRLQNREGQQHFDAQSSPNPRHPPRGA